MSDQGLRDLLAEVADEQSPVVVAPDTYRRGRRRHRRNVLLSGLALLGVVALGIGGVSEVLQPLDPVPAADGNGPAMPARIHAVPERLAHHLGAGGYRWHADVASPDLAIGTTAAVYPVNEGAVAAVSAVDGSYAGLDLPGFDESSYFRFEGGMPVALSPAGDRLAYTWNPDVISGSGRAGYEPSGVRIVDLSTGEVSSFRIPGGFGVYAHSFSWSPDGRYVVYSLDVTTSPTGGVYRNFTMERLDTRSGQRVRIEGLPRSDGSLAVSPRGEVASVGNGPGMTWLPGRTPEVRRFDADGQPWTAAWSPSGDRLAVGTLSMGWFSVGAPARRGLIARTAAEAPSGSEVRVLGWVGQDEVTLLHRTTEDGLAVSLAPVSRSSDEAGRAVVEVDPSVGQWQLSLATDLLAQPTRDFDKPRWPIDWVRALLWGLPVMAVLLLAGVWWRRKTPGTPPD